MWWKKFKKKNYQKPSKQKQKSNWLRDETLQPPEESVTTLFHRHLPTNLIGPPRGVSTTSSLKVIKFYCELSKPILWPIQNQFRSQTGVSQLQDLEDIWAILWAYLTVPLWGGQWFLSSTSRCSQPHSYLMDLVFFSFFPPLTIFPLLFL